MQLPKIPGLESVSQSPQPLGERPYFVLGGTEMLEPQVQSGPPRLVRGKKGARRSAHLLDMIQETTDSLAPLPKPLLALALSHSGRAVLTSGHSVHPVRACRAWLQTPRAGFCGSVSFSCTHNTHSILGPWPH